MFLQIRNSCIEICFQKGLFFHMGDVIKQLFFCPSHAHHLVQYQMEMMRSLRHVNMGHLPWAGTSPHTVAFVRHRALLDSQFSYQHAIEESVVLIYGQQEFPLLFFSSLNIIATTIFAFCLFASRAAGRPSQVNTNPVSAAASAAAKSRQGFLLSVYFFLLSEP